MMYGMLQGQIMSNPLVARSSLWFQATEWRSDHQIGRAKLDSKNMPVGVEDHQGLLFSAQVKSSTKIHHAQKVEWYNTTFLVPVYPLLYDMALMHMVAG